jgi:hypothetical protein
MKPIFNAAIFGSLILCISAASQAQRINYSISMPSTSSAGSAAQPSQARGPALPPLPGPLPSFSTNTVQVQLEDLNLRSTHMAPPRLNLFAPGRRGILPQLPFALDPVAGRNPIAAFVDGPGICVE